MFTAVSFAVLLSAQPVVSDQPDQAPVAWVIRPESTPDDFPSMARQLGLSGRAIIECEVNPQGVPVNCRSLTSVPAHLGFDRAAVNVVQRGRLTPITEDGTDAPSFKVTVPFRSKPYQARAEWTGPQPTRVQLNAARHYAVRAVSSRPPIAERMRQSWQMDRLPVEQRDALMAWITELAPSREQEINDTAVMAARVLAAHGADEWPRQRPANFADWQRDMNRARPDNPQAVMSEIARRYCATFSCVTD